MLREHDLRIHSHLQVVTTEPGHILDDNTLDDPRLNICNYLLKAGTIEGCPRNAVVDVEAEIFVAVFKSVLLQDFLLRLDLSRVISAIEYECRHDSDLTEIIF